MQKNLLSFLLAFIVCVSAKAQVSVTASSGTTNGNYTTLSAAFNAINAGTHQGVITITLTGAVTEVTSASLDSSGNPSGSSYTSISIQPAAATPVTITGAVAGALINLNGADNVTIDGIALAPGGATLTISNTNTAATATTVRFINDATSNAIKNTTLRGAGAGLSTGVVFFSTGLLTGNDNNTLLNNDIDGSGSAAIGILSTGTTTTFAHQNSGNTVTNTWVHDFFNSTLTAAVGIYLSGGNTDWTFTGNSMYQTVLRTVTANTIFYGMFVAPSYAGDKHTITGNFFGGSAPGASATGGNMQLSGSGSIYAGFIGFYIQTGGTGNLVDGNIVRNITLTSFSAASSAFNAGFYGLISGFSGTSTFSNNQVRDINLINNVPAGFLIFQGLYINGRVSAAGTVTPTFNVTGNTVANIVTTSSGNADFQFYGLRLEASSAASLTSTAIAQVTFNASGNTVNSYTITTTGTSTFLRGIGVISGQGGSGATLSSASLRPKATLTNNTVRDLVVGGNLASYSTPTVSGIQVTGASVTNTDVQNISGNTIYNLSATTTSELNNAVAGIIGNNSTFVIEKNKIYNLTNTATSNVDTPIISGINIRSVLNASTIRNNFVAIGTATTTNTNIFGILNNVTSTAPINIYHNTVYITGTAGTRNSVGFYRGNEAMQTMAIPITSTVDVRNNIFYNIRSGGTGNNYAIGSMGTTNWTSDYNILKSSNPATVAFWNNTSMDLATYQTASGQDANSRNINVNFVDAANADLHLAGASNGDMNLAGINVGVTDDIDNQTRSTIYPYRGADEASTPLPVSMISFNGLKQGGSNKLEWTTAAEINSKGFEVLRSADGISFTSLGFVASKAVNGNSSSRITYTFNDNHPVRGKNFYRLKQVDRDGRYTLSNIVVLDGNKADFVLNQNYPNPVKGATTITYSLGEDSKVRLDLYGFDGKLIGSVVNANQTTGFYTVQVDAKQIGLSAGSYIYQLTTVDANGKAKVITRQLIVQ